MKKLAVFLVILSGILWGIIGLFVRTLQSQGLGSLEIVAVRMAISAVIFSVFVLIFDRKLFVIKKRDLWCFFGTGVVSVAAFSYCYFKAIEMASLSAASILLYTAPMFVMIFSVFLFKERISTVKIASLVLAFFGCVLVTGVLSGNNGVTIIGVLFGISSGVCYALYSIFSRFALDRGYNPMTISLYTFIFAGIAVLPVINIKSVVMLMTSNIGELMFCVLFAVVSCVLPYITYTMGLKFLKSSTASIIASIEPVVATILGAAVFNESVSFPFGYIGIALVLVSIVLINCDGFIIKNN